MMKPFAVWSLGILGLVTALSAEETIGSRLESLTLYLQGATAVRVVELPEAAAARSIRISGLPGETDASGLRVRLRGQPNAYIGGVVFEAVRYETLPLTEQRLALQQALQVRIDERTDLTAEVLAISAEAGFVERLKDAALLALAEGSGDADLASAWFRQGLQLEQQKLAIERRIRQPMEALDRQIVELERELALLERRERALTGQLSVEIIGELSGRAELELTLPFSGSSWQPRYRLDAQPLAGKWTMDFIAQIRNGSGESWQSVPVTLMTHRAVGRMQAPSIPPVYLQAPQRPVVGVDAAPMARSRTPAPEMMMALAAEPPPPEVELLGTQFALKIPSPVELEAFSTSRLLVEQVSSPAEFWSATSPMLDTRAYLQGKGSLATPWPVLAGPVLLTVEGASVGQSRLQFLNPGDPLEVGFGENPAILVTWRELEVQAANRGIIDRVRTYTRHYQTVVRNRMAGDHDVRVSDRFPISRDAQIRVRRIEPADATVDEESGVFERQLMIPAGAERTLDTRFEVSAPRDWVLFEPNSTIW